MSTKLEKFIYMVYYIDRLSYVKPPLHLWDKAYLVMVDNVFDVFLENPNRLTKSTANDDSDDGELSYLCRHHFWLGVGECAQSLGNLARQIQSQLDIP
ncbi:hypothetical protein STEG23_025184, partial [Scotinomys teguina]